MLRLLFIAISGLCGGLVFILLFASLYPVAFPDWLGVTLFVSSCALGSVIAWQLCERLNWKLGDYSHADYERLGLLHSEQFSVRRVFEVEEYGDEGLHFFLELNDGRVLFLCGQYLYEYQEISDDPDLNQPATFPCAKFEIRRHKTKHWVHSIICQGPYMKPEVLLPHYSQAYQDAFGFPTDGEIFNVTYGELLARLSELKA